MDSSKQEGLLSQKRELLSENTSRKAHKVGAGLGLADLGAAPVLTSVLTAADTGGEVDGIISIDLGRAGPAAATDGNISLDLDLAAVVGGNISIDLGRAGPAAATGSNISLDLGLAGPASGGLGLVGPAAPASASACIIEGCGGASTTNATEFSLCDEHLDERKNLSNMFALEDISQFVEISPANYPAMVRLYNLSLGAIRDGKLREQIGFTKGGVVHKFIGTVLSSAERTMGVASVADAELFDRCAAIATIIDGNLAHAGVQTLDGLATTPRKLRYATQKQIVADLVFLFADWGVSFTDRSRVPVSSKGGATAIYIITYELFLNDQQDPLLLPEIDIGTTTAPFQRFSQYAYASHAEPGAYSSMAHSKAAADAAEWLSRGSGRHIVATFHLISSGVGESAPGPRPVPDVHARLRPFMFSDLIAPQVVNLFEGLLITLTIVVGGKNAWLEPTGHSPGDPRGCKIISNGRPNSVANFVRETVAQVVVGDAGAAEVAPMVQALAQQAAVLRGQRCVEQQQRTRARHERCKDGQSARKFRKSQAKVKNVLAEACPLLHGSDAAFRSFGGLLVDKSNVSPRLSQLELPGSTFEFKRDESFMAAQRNLRSEALRANRETLIQGVVDVLVSLRERMHAAGHVRGKINLGDAMDGVYNVRIVCSSYDNPGDLALPSYLSVDALSPHVEYLP